MAANGVRRRPRGGLTEADQAAWRAYTAGVAPLRDDPKARRPAPAAAPQAGPPAPPPEARPPAAPAEPAKRAPAPPRRRAGGSVAAAAAIPPPEIQVGIAPSGLDQRRWTALRRGRTRPERTLDLHGHRAQEAHAALRAFVRAAWTDGLRCIAVVTGKGSTNEGGVLRRELPHWLNAPDLRPLLLGAAHPHATNPGAVHLLLRRPGGGGATGAAPPRPAPSAAGKAQAGTGGAAATTTAAASRRPGGGRPGAARPAPAWPPPGTRPIRR